MCQRIHDALDQVRGLRHTERTAVGNATRGLVGMDRIHSDKCMLKVIRAGADMEQASRKLRWLCGGIKGTVISKRVDTQGLHGAIFISSDLCFDVVIAAKTRAA